MIRYTFWKPFPTNGFHLSWRSDVTTDLMKADTDIIGVQKVPRASSLCIQYDALFQIFKRAICAAQIGITCGVHHRSANEVY